MRFIESQKPFRAPRELGKVWNIEYRLIGKGYQDVAKQRGIDLGHKVFQVFASPFKLKTSESGEDNACCRRRNVGLPFQGQIERIGT